MAQVKGLLDRIESGEATGAEFAAANQLLKNNSITVDVQTDESLNELEKSLSNLKKKPTLTDFDKEELRNGNVIKFNGG